MLVNVVSTYDVGPEIIRKVNQLIDNYESKKVINEELVAWFPKLRKIGYKVAILSNATTELRKRLHGLGIHRHIDGIVISAEVGFQKPHKEAFDVVFQKLGVLPQEVIFL